MYSLAIESIVGSKLEDGIKNRALGICNSAHIHTNEGQIFDILMSYKDFSKEEGYIEMATLKTAVPIAASIKFGSIIGNATEEEMENLGRYGCCVGLAFQIKDDIIDISKNKGRELGTDLRKGNKTLMVIKTLEKANDEVKKRLLKVLGNNKAGNDEVNEIIRIIKESGSMEYAEEYARNNIKEAKKYLQKVKLNKNSFEFFNKFADYVVEREF